MLNDVIYRQRLINQSDRGFQRYFAHLQKGVGMSIYNHDDALSNLCAFGKNPYPGRFIIIGLAEDGKNVIQIYGITGRSVGSRNRVLREGSDGRLFTRVADPNKMDKKSNPDLIIYDAMMDVGKRFIVSNGQQTNVVARGVGDLELDLRGQQYEPDAPNYTPRITAVCTLPHDDKGLIFELSILRKSPWCAACNRFTYTFTNIEPGFGFGIMTYSGNGNPLPIFDKDPILFPLEDSPEEIGKKYWGILNPDNRVALAVKAIDTITAKSFGVMYNKNFDVSSIGKIKCE